MVYLFCFILFSPWLIGLKGQWVLIWFIEFHRITEWLRLAGISESSCSRLFSSKNTQSKDPRIISKQLFEDLLWICSLWAASLCQWSVVYTVNNYFLMADSLEFQFISIASCIIEQSLAPASWCPSFRHLWTLIRSLLSLHFFSSNSPSFVSLSS